MPKKTTERLLAEMRRAYDLVQERRAGEAVEVYRALLADARQVGLDSAHLHWAYAVACDYSGDLEMAFEQMTTAVAKDPLAPPFRHSFELITGRIRAALAAPERAADDPSTPRLYALLVVVYCWGGLGRAGTIAGCLVTRARLPSAPLVGATRDGAIQPAGQEQFVWDLATR